MSGMISSLRSRLTRITTRNTVANSLRSQLRTVWTRHRCARIVFSLSYHSGKMSPQECVDHLVDRAGHERSAAAAEVRRSIMGGYSPLYQAAYMLGGLQLRDMHRELVQGGKMSNRQFHDAILHKHSIPIELLRAYMTGQEL